MLETQCEMFFNHAINPQQTGTNQQNVYSSAFCLLMRDNPN